MNEQEIRSIFEKELGASDQVFIALMNSYHRVSMSILEKLLPNLQDPEKKLLNEATYAKSRLTLMLNLKAELDVPHNLVDDILFIHRQWLEILNYFYAHYDTMNFDRFKKMWTKNQVKEARDYVSDFYEKIGQSAARDNTAAVPQNHFIMIDDMVRWFQQFLLGDELGIQYIEEFNKTLPILREYQTEMNAPVSGKAS